MIKTGRNNFSSISTAIHSSLTSNDPNVRLAAVKAIEESTSAACSVKDVLIVLVHI